VLRPAYLPLLVLSPNNSPSGRTLVLTVNRLACEFPLIYRRGSACISHSAQITKTYCFLFKFSKSSLDMPVDWRTDKPLGDFVKDDGYSRQTEQHKRHQGRVFNNRDDVCEQPIRNNHRDIHEVEGSLEVQRDLLLKLAERENRIIEKPESMSISSLECLERLKTDTVQAIQKTWNQRSRPTAKKSLFFSLL
jgi:hypothetical protein